MIAVPIYIVFTKLTNIPIWCTPKLQTPTRRSKLGIQRQRPKEWSHACACRTSNRLIPECIVLCSLIKCQLLYTRPLLHFWLFLSKILVGFCPIGSHFSISALHTSDCMAQLIFMFIYENLVCSSPISHHVPYWLCQPRQLSRSIEQCYIYGWFLTDSHLRTHVVVRGWFTILESRKEKILHQACADTSSRKTVSVRVCP
jgi:hypothetical protein